MLAAGMNAVLASPPTNVITVMPRRLSLREVFRYHGKSGLVENASHRRAEKQPRGTIDDGRRHQTE